MPKCNPKTGDSFGMIFRYFLNVFNGSNDGFRFDVIGLIFVKMHLKINNLI